MVNKLNGKFIVVTGATSGIGFACVRNLVNAGAQVLGIGRSEKRNEKAKKAILNSFPNGNLEYLLCDFSSQSQVRKLGNEIKNFLDSRHQDHLDGLINNAGVYLEQKKMSEDGIEMTFAVNHLGAFLLTLELLPMLQASGNGKILTTSSYSHITTPLILKRIADPWPYIGFLAYKRSKLCNVLFTYELNRRYEDITTIAVDPGLVNTGIASKGSDGISDWIWRSRRKKGTSPDVPARTYLYLIHQEEIDPKSGFYYKNCEPKKPSQKAEDPGLAAQLWEKSEHLTGLS